jgi:putative hydrolase of the HAD superfamily
MLRAVTLDFWNTLFVDHHGREREHRRATWLRARLDELGAPAGAAARAPVSDGAIADALAAGFDYFDQVWRDERRTLLASETTEATLAALGVRLSDESFAQTVEYFERLLLEVPPEPMPGALGALPLLAERYKLAVVCDTGYSPGSVLTELLAANGMLEPFSYLYFSNEHGMSKPDVRVFKHTLAQLDVRAGEAAHVGDMQRTDIAGAQAAGMAAVHFVGASNRDAEHSTADLIVRHFDELPAALGGLICAGC